VSRVRKIKNNFFILLGGLVIVINYLIICSPRVVFAAASVTLTEGGTWTIGTKGASSVTTIGNTWTVTNDASGGTEDLTIGVTDSGGWTAGTTSAANQFVLKLGGTPSSSSGSVSASDTVITTGTTLVTGLLNNGTANFGLSFTTPSSGGEGAHTLTVTLTATNFVQYLTWPGSTHSEAACTSAGGSVVTDGTYTFCKYSGTDVSCPTDWPQAANWQQYSEASWSDDCGNHPSSAPVVWANTAASLSGVIMGETYVNGDSCNYPADWVLTNRACGAYCRFQLADMPIGYKRISVGCY